MVPSSLKQTIVSAVQSGFFGDNFNLVDIVASVEDEGQDHFSSDVCFAKVVLSKGDDEQIVHVVIKKQQDNPFVREMMNSDVQFYNEVLMYQEIVPFLSRDKRGMYIFPRLYFSRSTLGDEYENDILVIENLRPFGYRLADEKVFMHYDHIVLVLKKLGRFHALSYSAKRQDPDGFFQFVGKLKESTWVHENKDESNRFLTLSMERGIFPLVESTQNLDTLEKFTKQVQDPFKIALNLIRPEEPLAVICHGNFNRNNMLFKYDDKGKPLDVKFFDLATARYASPAIDLAFFLFMNTTADLRRAHWQDFFKIYHDALAEAVPGSRVPPLEVLRREVEKKAVYGYIHCSFFIPMMMDNTPKCDLDDFVSMPSETLDEIIRTKGGDQATKVISDIVRDLIRLNSI